MNTLDKIVNTGKKIVASLSLIALASCSTTYARRDYNQYPAHKAEIALYNLRQIAKDICEESQVTPTQFICTDTSATLRGGDCPDGYHKVSHALGYVDCKTTATIEFEDIRKIVPGPESVKICFKDGICTQFNLFDNYRQAQDFAEALNIYLRER